MRKWSYLFLTVIFTFCFSMFIFAETSVLIDFNKLKANGDGNDPTKSLDGNDTKMLDYTNHDENRKHHMPTLLDYSSVASSNFTPEDIKGMAVSLSAQNWEVHLNSSAAHNKNKALSYCKEWHTKFVPILRDTIESTTDTAKSPAQDPQGYNILGIRIHFPDTPYNCWAVVNPPYEIPAYEDITTNYKGEKLSAQDVLKKENYGNKFDYGYGVVKNVQTLKYIKLKAYGTQFKNSLAIILKDDNNITTEYHFGQYLDFSGWKEMAWVNPNYIKDAANRDLYVIPLYPRNVPFVKLEGFRIYRQGDQLGGDFVTYIKDVTITYDLAVLDKPEPIEHEEAWRILKDRTLEARDRELNKIGNNQILQFIERKKMHKEISSQ